MDIRGVIMRKRFKESEIINILRAIKVKISGGMNTEEACRSLGVSDKSYYRWRKLYGSMGLKNVQDFRRTSVCAGLCRILNWARAY